MSQLCLRLIEMLKDALILINLGASDYCFVDKFSFTSYTRYNLPKTGFSANKDSTFTISGR